MVKDEFNCEPNGSEDNIQMSNDPYDDLTSEIIDLIEEYVFDRDIDDSIISIKILQCLFHFFVCANKSEKKNMAKKMETINLRFEEDEDGDFVLTENIASKYVLPLGIANGIVGLILKQPAETELRYILAVEDLVGDFGLMMNDQEEMLEHLSKKHKYENDDKLSLTELIYRHSTLHREKK